jgi:hypothetical protein
MSSKSLRNAGLVIAGVGAVVGLYGCALARDAGDASQSAGTELRQQAHDFGVASMRYAVFGTALVTTGVIGIRKSYQ